MGRSQALPIDRGLALPAEELEVTFARAGGPGGQNVNKVETKVLLRFDVGGSSTLSAEQKQRIRTRLATRLTNAGEIVVQAARHRTRERNLADARERLAVLLREALVEPKKRRPTRPTRSSGERRLSGKRRRSDVKRARRGEEG